MEVIILCKMIFRDKIASVPVQRNIIHKVMILIAEKEPVLPILLIFIGDFLLNFRHDTDISTETSLDLLHLYVFLILRASLVKLFLVIRWNFNWDLSLIEKQI
jgi:hypothetical protein